MIVPGKRAERLEYQGVMRDDKVELVLNCIVNDLVGYVERNEHAANLCRRIRRAHKSVVIPALTKMLGNSL